MTEALLVPVEQRQIDFYGDELVALRDAEGTVWVPVRRLCEAIGVDRQGQIDRIARDPVLSQQLQPMPVRLSDGCTFRMDSLPVKYVRVILRGINAGRVRSGIRGKLIAYQEALIDLIDRHMGEALAPQQERSFRSTPYRGKNQDEGYIYLLRSGDGYYKIGRSRRPWDRARMIGTNLPHPVTLLHVIAVSDMVGAEAFLHERFAARRMNGEWFRLTAEEVGWVCALERLEPEEISGSPDLERAA